MRILKEKVKEGENMADLWGGRFTKETDKQVFDFNASINFDRRLFPQDIRGSIVHAKMLGKQGIISEEESGLIVKGLTELAAKVVSGEIEMTGDYEDIHSFNEAKLIELIGETGKKLHTGRSRNDQVALDMKMYIRDAADELSIELSEMLDTLLALMKENTDTFMPGFTHMQKAQPVNLAHHLGAYFEMFYRDQRHIRDLRMNRMDTCPLGSGALAGTTYALDREYTAKELGFVRPTYNSMDGVSDRDYLLEFVSCLSTVMMHLSRFSEEIICWNSDEYKYVELDDAFSTGSSIMPQKKNPDIAELVRGKCGRVYGAMTGLFTVMKGIPLAYNKDMQEDKEMVFDAIDTTGNCLVLFTEMLKTTAFNKDRMKESAGGGFTNATDAADYLVKKGMAFRDAHRVSGELVLLCIEKGIALNDLPLEEYQRYSSLFEEDIYDAISIGRCVKSRMTEGAPGDIEKEIRSCEVRLSDIKEELKDE